MSALAPAAPATLVGPVCSRCSFGWGRDRVQVRHESIAAIYSCGGPAPAFAPVAAVVEVPAPAPAPVAPVAPVEPGHGEIWVVGRAVFKCVAARSSGRVLAHELVSPLDVEGPLEWAYRGLASRVLRAGRPAPLALVATIGRVTGYCVFCSKQIDTDASLAVGYGPKCAAKRGLPWGA